MTDITVKTQTLPSGQVGVPYEAAIGVTGNATTVSSVTVTNGSLPPGLSVSDVRVTGTPTKNGTYTFKVTATDTAGGVQSGTLTIVIASPSPVDILAQSPAAQNAKLWPS